MEQKKEEKQTTPIIEKPTKPVIKKRLSVFKNSLKINSVYHFKKYYQQVVDQPDPSMTQVTKDIAKKSEETVTKQRSKKKRWLSAVFMLINVGIVVGILLYNFLGQEDPMSISELLTRQINWIWLLIGFLVFLLVNFVDSIRVNIMVYHITKRSRPFTSYKSVTMCRFYDCVTPMSTGGQPFQVFYLKKRGLSAGTATSVPIAKFLYSQFFFIIFSLIVLICQHAYITSFSPAIITVAYVGFALSALLIVAVLFLSISKKVAPSMTIGILKLLNKVRIVKDYRKAFVKVMKTVREYVTTMRQFVSNWWIALSMMFFSVLYLIINYSFPFIVYATFMPLDSNWFEIYIQLFTLGLICDLASSIIPLPGGTGMAEISFAVLFSSFFITTDGYNIAVWALLLWRIFTYYGYLLQGLLVMFYDYLFGNKKIAPLLKRFKEEDEEKERLEREKEPEIKVVKNRRKHNGK